MPFARITACTSLIGEGETGHWALPLSGPDRTQREYKRLYSEGHY